MFVLAVPPVVALAYGSWRLVDVPADLMDV
jgi:hypothetical protein